MSDYFSAQSAIYAKTRPTYPKELFEKLNSLCENHELAWDCATGNGQTAISLSAFFKRVYATDMSEKQISNSFKRDNIIYKVERAEHSSLNKESVDLITVSTAIHWFDIPEFYKEVSRVLNPRGVLAVWSYGGCTIEPGLNEVVDHFSFEILKDYWPAEANMNWRDKYRSLPFPYPLIEMPLFNATAEQNLHDFVNYMNSWSAVNIYKEKHCSNPIDLIYDELATLWNDKNKIKQITWPLFMKCGKK